MQVTKLNRTSTPTPPPLFTSPTPPPPPAPRSQPENSPTQSPSKAIKPSHARAVPSSPPPQSRLSLAYNGSTYSTLPQKHLHLHSHLHLPLPLPLPRILSRQGSHRSWLMPFNRILVPYISYTYVAIIILQLSPARKELYYVYMNKQHAFSFPPHSRR